jgi:hypothetical protein
VKTLASLLLALIYEDNEWNIVGKSGSFCSKDSALLQTLMQEETSNAVQRPTLDLTVQAHFIGNAKQWYDIHVILGIAQVYSPYGRKPQHEVD